MDKGFQIEELLEFCHFINQDSTKKLSTNITAGFPTETMDNVKATIHALNEFKPYLVWANVCEYKDSFFVKSHSLEQLSKEIIQDHTKVYSKFLQHENIPFTIIK